MYSPTKMVVMKRNVVQLPRCQIKLPSGGVVEATGETLPQLYQNVMDFIGAARVNPPEATGRMDPEGRLEEMFNSDKAFFNIDRMGVIQLSV